MSDNAAIATPETDTPEGDQSETIQQNNAPKVAPKINPEDAAEESIDARDVGGVAGQRLRSFIERIEKLEEEKSHLAEDIKEVYAEAKGVGFEPRIMRKIVKIKNMDTEKRREEEELIDLYKSAIGLL